MESDYLKWLREFVNKLGWELQPQWGALLCIEERSKYLDYKLPATWYKFIIIMACNHMNGTVLGYMLDIM